MNQQQQEVHDLKGQGMPPPYTAGPPPEPARPLAQHQPVHVGVACAAPAVLPVVNAVQQNMGPNAAPRTCVSCNVAIVTRVEHKPSTKTHLFAVLLCALGCWCCIWVPNVIDSCQNADHYCPNCNAYLGSYNN